MSDSNSQCVAEQCAVRHSEDSAIAILHSLSPSAFLDSNQMPKKVGLEFPKVYRVTF
ncbi:hypothetical protein K9N68_19435 [Kovacikia minuta CCNUW1]|uniref:hypothetical protein n=1 Tax=Kovacikia minuta TaxID=2931930 RepID=UPI001CCFE43D|nr:hypothetical protein [Kovacikia minuta]UBF23920.1 hypothetical protein K9N68_19435 [Kovacikia minuta CCNUW1]